LGILGESVNPSGIQLASHPFEIHFPIGNAVIDEQQNYWSIDIEHNVCIHNHLCSLYTSNGYRHIEHYALSHCHIVYIYMDYYDIAQAKKNTMNQNENLQVSVDSENFVNSQWEKNIGKICTKVK
jgi:hypothetical protein